MLQWTAAVAILVASNAAAGRSLTPPASYGAAGRVLVSVPHRLVTAACAGAEGSDPEIDPQREACGWLRRAEQEVGEGRLPEAAAFALRAERSASGAPRAASIERVAQILRAEALARLGRTGQAHALADAAGRSATGEGRSEADLLAARLLLESGRVSEAAASYARLLSEDALADEARTPALLLAAEAALAAGDADAARRWLDEGLGRSLAPEVALAARIRLADAMDAAGDRRAALALLRRVEGEAGASASGVLAAARAERLAALPARTAAPESALSGLAASSDRSAARTGREALAWALLDRGAVLDALGTLAPLVSEPASPLEASWLQSALGHALAVVPALAETDEGCRSIVAAIGTQLVDLSRRAGAPDGLDAVAACSQRIGLELHAARLRAASLRFSNRPRQRAGVPGSQVPLADGPIAGEAAYSRGDFAAAQAMSDAGAWARLAAAGATAQRARAIVEPASRRDSRPDSRLNR